MVVEVAGNLLKVFGLKPSKKKSDYLLAKKVLPAGNERKVGLRNRLREKLHRRRSSVSSTEGLISEDESSILYEVETRILGRMSVCAKVNSITPDDGLSQLRSIPRVELLFEEESFFREMRALGTIVIENSLLTDCMKARVQVDVMEHKQLKLEDLVLVVDPYQNKICREIEPREESLILRQESPLLLTIEPWAVLQARKKRSPKRKKGRFKLVCEFGFNLMYARRT
eukprot:snap_masked-scaffold_25-processed-gene-4.49-mRNA-1 protein AED:1.00 eAED:1.00 QI:0/-1/0/0/-1/1/1/0/226